MQSYRLLRWFFCTWLGLAQFLPFVIAQVPEKRADRIAAVETGLMPYVPIAGLSGWNLEKRRQYHQVPGLSIAVVRNYHIDWVKSYGLADTSTRQPVTPHTLFSAGSISKLVTALAALRLVEQRRLSLDTPINHYLTSWKLPENEFTRRTPITLRMLLSHRGGTSQSAYFGFTPNQTPLPSIVDILAGKPGTESRPVIVNSEPNQGFRYSGGGYLVVQLAMMDVTGKDFATLTDELLFKPLRLRHSTFAQPLPASLATRASWAYSSNSWFKGMPYVYPQQAAAGLYTTAHDLALLLIDIQASYGGKRGLLQQASAQAMMTPQTQVSEGFYDEQMGLGVFLLRQQTSTGEDGRYFTHTGVNAGFLAEVTGSLTGGNGVIVMMNNDNGANELAKEIRRAVAAVYNWKDFLPRPLVRQVLPDSLLNAYVGRYQRGADEVVQIRREGNLLVEQINNGKPILCVPISPDTIALTDYTTHAYFSRGPSGKIDSLRLAWEKTPWPRLAEDQYLPSELIRMGRIKEAMEGYAAMHLNVFQLTYMAYDFLQQRPANLPAAEGILMIAKEQFPREAIVHARLGDLLLKRGDKAGAIAAYTKAVELDSTDQNSEEVLKRLLAR
ncbi:hypothetical protein BWI97_22840 [Siphonobacter sp. BAB-5405]|uniref:serine hydrolase n=1 Tax=Siphonobacter sp. BAB-5405 TaxID=1864825 RepID=UPI000C8085CC|nr:serine hydrolase [Siphonobacter sp. BAB-5405]PMD90333.1 hypothetical protein BWI97_22840 [Siphonobacter sp. BAB-5405]